MRCDKKWDLMGNDWEKGFNEVWNELRWEIRWDFKWCEGLSEEWDERWDWDEGSKVMKEWLRKRLVIR
jgi:hypothetical protein